MLLGDSIYLLKNKGKWKKRSKNIGFFQESHDFLGNFNFDTPSYLLVMTVYEA